MTFIGKAHVSGVSGRRSKHAQVVIFGPSPPPYRTWGAAGRFFVSTFLLTRCARAAHVRRKRGHRRKHKRSRAKSRHKKYCRERAKRLGTNVRRGNPFDMDNRPTVCLRCDRGQHRRCERLPHCRARFRSPSGLNRRELNRAAARAERQRLRAQRASGARDALELRPRASVLMRTRPRRRARRHRHGGGGGGRRRRRRRRRRRLMLDNYGGDAEESWVLLEPVPGPAPAPEPAPVPVPAVPEAEAEAEPVAPDGAA